MTTAQKRSSRPSRAARPSRRSRTKPAEATAHTSRLFRTGGSLAVRIPNAWGLGKTGDAVRLVRKGRRIVIEAADEWPEEFLACLGSCAGEPPLPRMPQQTIAEAFKRVM
jgi:virulence-associated protein VagC